MTYDEFEFWEKIFLAVINSGQYSRFDVKDTADKHLQTWKQQKELIKDKNPGPYR